MEKEWVPLKYQQQKLNGWSFIIQVIYFSVQRNDSFFFFLHQLSFMMQRDDFTSLQRIDFIMQRIVAKRLSTT